jgi:putative ABC transport system permease protein
MEAIWQDLRFGLRMLRRSPGFALVAVITLALGIGANAAIFSVVRGVLLRPLPYEEPDRLVTVAERNTRGGSMSVAWPNFVDWRTSTNSFLGLTVADPRSFTVLGGSEPVQAHGALVGEDFWKVFPARPLQGRLTVPGDHVPGTAPVMVVSRSFWQNELGGRPLESYNLEIAGMHAAVVGVVPDALGYPTGAQFWVPAELDHYSDSRSAHNWSVVGRLRDGVSVASARQEVDQLTKRIIAGVSGEDPDFLATGAVMTPLLESIVATARRPLYLLLAAAGLVLLIACINLAGTLLARGAGRERELAVRAALGAGSGRIVRQLLTESLLLAGFGALAGLGVGMLVVRAVVTSSVASLPRLSQVSVDGTVLTYTAAVAVLTAVLFGLLPARRLARSSPSNTLRSGSRGNALEAKSGVWRFLVDAEVALALVLLVGSGLLIRSFQSLVDEEPGFDDTRVDVMRMSLSQIKYPTGSDHALWYRTFLEQLNALPDVADAGVISTVPIATGLPNGRLELDEDPNKHAVAGYVVASAGAFGALDIPLLEGRLFDDADSPDGQHVAIVSQSFADLAWPGEAAIGKSVNGGGMDNFWQDRRFARVVGVVGDVRYEGLDEPVYPTVYFPYSQRPFRLQYSASVVVRAASGDPTTLFGVLRATLHGADADVPPRIATLSSALHDSLGQRRFVMLLLGGFSLTALVLSWVGIFGVVSYGVAQRTREMGIRIALGATPAGMRRMLVGNAMRMVAGGLVVGLGGAFVVTRLLGSMLYGVRPLDPVAIVGAVTLLSIAGLVASWIPAASGTRVDPIVTMRAE